MPSRANKDGRPVVGPADKETRRRMMEEKISRGRKETKRRASERQKGEGKKTGSPKPRVGEPKSTYKTLKERGSDISEAVDKAS